MTPDHLDRHGSFEGYLAAKARLLEQQQPDDTAVLNFDDPAVRGLAERTRARVLPFRTLGPLEHGAFWEAGCVVLAEPGGARERFSLSALRLPGVHNRENAVAALAAVVAAGAPGAPRDHRVRQLRRACRTACRRSRALGRRRVGQRLEGDQPRRGAALAALLRDAARVDRRAAATRVSTSASSPKRRRAACAPPS